MLWQRSKDTLAQELPPQQFQTWIKPLAFVSSSNTGKGVHVTLSVPSDFHREWIDREFKDQLQEVLEQEIEEQVSFAFITVESEEAELEPVALAVNEESRAQSKAAVQRPVHGGTHRKNPSAPSREGFSAATGAPSKTGTPLSFRPETVPGSLPRTLNPKYTFETFIEADCNRLARSAGVAVAKRPGETSFNPFLIYGKVGLGKTHLAHAIGNEIVRNQPRAQVLYLTSEAFTNYFVYAIQNNTLGEFTQAFRQIDVLIVDDIQFFGGKEKTQEQFFHLFNELHQGGKQIILCADRSPAEIAGIEERLLSRFRWGLSADVQPPDLETRTAILQRHASEAGLELTGEIIDYIAYNVKDNIRLLEGAFNKLLALHSVTRQKIDLVFVQDALQDLIDNRTRKSISASQIRDIVAEFYDMDPDLLIGKSRKRPIVDARQVAMHFCKRMTQHSLEAIGRRFGGRDHSTVIHACKAIQARIDTDPRFVEELGQIEQLLKNRVLHS
ncbi:MAG: chromosomal replication initiator protein DnaA [Bacteroidota bacterium]|nr:chromosomal replication initiator protein DnaA [Bacteroidota bacterium]